MRSNKEAKKPKKDVVKKDKNAPAPLSQPALSVARGKPKK